MPTRKYVHGTQELLNSLPYGFAGGFFDEIEADVNVPDNPVFTEGHRLTLRYGNEEHGTGVVKFYVQSQMPQAVDGFCINPIHGVLSDAMMQDLRLDRELPSDTAVSFLFVCTGRDADRDFVISSDTSFYVIDDPTKASSIQFILAICRHKQKPDDWCDIAGWSSQAYGHAPAQPLYPHIRDYLRFQDRRGSCWSIFCYQPGVRMPEFNAKGQYLWAEQHQTYDSFGSLVAARRSYVRKICARLLALFEDGGYTNYPLSDLLTIHDRCELFNSRIAALRTYEGMQNLESYTVTERVMQKYLTVVSSNNLYTVTQVERRIAQFERLVELRETFAECFKQMEPEIKGVCGHLSTSNVRFAEIEVPARHSLPGDKIMEVHQFGYTPQGVRAAGDWLAKEKAAFDEGCDFIRERFKLRLQDDGALQPISDAEPKQ